MTSCLQNSLELVQIPPSTSHNFGGSVKCMGNALITVSSYRECSERLQCRM